MPLRLSDFDYELPDELIAQEPEEPRDASRLLVVPGRGPLQDHRFFELDELLLPGDLVVLNDTRVLPARLVGAKPTGGRCELVLLEPLDEARRSWRALGGASKALREGQRLRFGELEATVDRAEGDGFYEVVFDRGGAALDAALEREGRVPLPPYIRREPRPEDRERYQTILARVPGSAAAPTAGLHFTEVVLGRLQLRGVDQATVTLHVGAGTFLPVRGEEVEGHRMYEERYDVPHETAEAVRRCRARGGRVVAVGTTVVRTLESAWEGDGPSAGPGRTSLFLRPGHRFRAVDVLLTNFHLPRSTLLLLVAAFAGRERVLEAYRHAVRERYRFFSYGDAMLVERGA